MCQCSFAAEMKLGCLTLARDFLQRPLVPPNLQKELTIISPEIFGAESLHTPGSV